MALENKSDFNKFLREEQFFDNSDSQLFTRIAKHQMRQTINEQHYEAMANSDYLVAFSTQLHSCCVGCVDMVNSTKISASIQPRKLSNYYEIFLNSMSKIIRRFRGRVIKNAGDCLLYYFPDSMDSLNGGFVDCLNCGLAMVEAQKTICDNLSSKLLPCLSYRISADYGYVTIMNTSNSSSMDMIGPPVNMCIKINRCANPNEFVIGGDLYERARKLKGYSFHLVGSYDVGFKHTYPAYKVI